ncbi:ATP-binding protein [Natronospirillum operosum]|uniref:ATP-binding protein n=1 Tax=Natronospirillum operosum TaxID=2759953 RepID=A0A4Z0WC55_9GAMM|nr:ATP-binding protein [Natronospirillum operosum]TGG91795.1 ATP-binding protein [Natronospirillum operosum]
MSLVDQVSISRRFQKSIRIDSDLGSKSALDGFICPQSSADVLMAMARHASETGQCAFTWTGPYGSGKSSLAVALSALLSGDPELKSEAERVFGSPLTKRMREVFPAGSNGWRTLPVVGRRGNPVDILGEALENAGYSPPRHKAKWTEEDVVSSLVSIANRDTERHGGFVLFVDEMGKFLEAATQNESDVYIFQQIAEAASRSNGRLLFIGVLHQAFDEYAHRLSHEMRNEWAKIQGRFVDLPVNTIGEEQIDLISRAIESADAEPQIKNQARTVARVARKDRLEDAERLAKMLVKCWPLHPAVACLLGPISRRRFGQNQRSIFGFLNSSEPHGFQDFLRVADDNSLYTPDKLWDYLRSNLEPSIIASPDGHRWAMAAEALDRCEGLGGDELLVRLLKTIAVIDLFKERSGLVPNFELLHTCFLSTSDESLRSALSTLDQWSLTIFKKFQDAHAIYAGSDFNIDQAVSSALEDIDEPDMEALKYLAGLQPILAKRHYHDTGAMRWFDVNITPAKDVIDVAKRFKPKEAVIGEFLLVVPTKGEEKGQIKTLCREAAKLSEQWDIVVGYSPQATSIVMLARELLALDKVNNDHPELAGDPVARREVAARLGDLQALLETELTKSIDGAKWYRKHHSPKQYRLSDLNSLASDLADSRFNQCPRLHNELLNRHKPSGSAIAGQNALLNRMVRKEAEPRLGIEGFPAEGGLYASILGASGLHRKTEDGWRFVAPTGDDSDEYRLYPAWNAATDHIKSNSNRSVSMLELYEKVWAKKPYGIKKGLMPVLSVAFILTQKDNLAVYRQGIFRARFDDIDVEYLAKDPQTIELRWMDLDKVSRKLLSEMADVVRNLDEKNELTHLAPIDVARGLVSIYEQLPNWTKRTMRLSARAIQVRDMFKRASDPNKFLFDDIPALVDPKNTDIIDQTDVHNIVSVVKEGLQELVQAYPAMAHRLRDMLLAELQVPNLSSQSLLELRERAENVKELAGDFRLDAFVGRLATFEGSDKSFESIASLAANKPPRDWVDPDMDRASIELADMAQKFLKAETFTRIKGRPEKRHAMAVVIGREGRPTPLLEEFEVADSDREAIDNIIERVSTVLGTEEPKDRNIVLAALAEMSTRYMQTSQAKIPKTEDDEVA